MSIYIQLIQYFTSDCILEHAHRELDYKEACCQPSQPSQMSKPKCLSKSLSKYLYMYFISLLAFESALLGYRSTSGQLSEMQAGT